jgi:hypothetical protein
MDFSTVGSLVNAGLVAVAEHRARSLACARVCARLRNVEGRNKLGTTTLPSVCIYCRTTDGRTHPLPKQHLLTRCKTVQFLNGR